MRKKLLFTLVLLVAGITTVTLRAGDNSAGKADSGQDTSAKEGHHHANGEPNAPANGNGEKHHGNGNGDKAELGQSAPDFTLADPNGQNVSLSDFQGEKVVVLEWTNYDCPFVKAHHEKGTFQKLANKYADRDVKWLTINSTHYATPEHHKAYLKDHESKATLLADPSGKVGRLYEAKTTPHLYVINKKGTLVYEGAIDNAPLGRVPEGKEYVNYVDQVLEKLTTSNGNGDANGEVSTSQTKPYGCTVKYPPDNQAQPK